MNSPGVLAASLNSVVKFKSRSDTDGDFPSTLVYQNGIYVTGEGQIGMQIGDDPFPPHAWINYLSDARSELTVSRTGFARDPKDTPAGIVLKAKTYAFRIELEIARTLPPLQRGRLLIRFRLPDTASRFIGFVRSHRPIALSTQRKALRLECKSS